MPGRRLRQLPRRGRWHRLRPDVPDGRHGPGRGVARHPADGDAGTPRGRRRGPDGDAAPVTVELDHLEVDVAVIGGGSSGLAAAAEASAPARPSASSTRVPATRSSAIYAGPTDRRPDAARACSTSTPTRSSSRPGPPRSSRSAPAIGLAGIVTARGRRAAARRRRGPWPTPVVTVDRRAGPLRGRRRWTACAAVVVTRRATAPRRPRRPTPSSSTSAWRRATSWRGWPAPCPVDRGRRRGRRPAAPARRRPRASSAAAWARPSPTSTTRGTAASPSSSCSSARARRVSAPCQGGACLPHVRSWIAARTGVVPEPFTARPASRQITLAEAAADALRRRLPADARSTTSTSRSARGWTGSVAGGGRGTTATRSRSTGRSARASRSATSSTLGKLVVSGPDVVELLERLYPCHVADIKPGRSRYALLLNERGHVMDDGMILRESETRFVLSFTSGGAANAEMWVRDWIDVWGLRVHVLDRTMSLAAINVTGPLAGDAAAPRRSGRPAALPRPRPCRRRRRPVPRHAPVVHGRGRLRAPPPGRPVGRAVAGAARRSARDLGHPAARPPGAVRAAGSRRAT